MVNKKQEYVVYTSKIIIISVLLLVVQNIIEINYLLTLMEIYYFVKLCTSKTY